MFENRPEKGEQPGVYIIENAEGEEREKIALSHPQADAFVRMGATYKMSIEEWRKREAEAKEEKVASKAPEAPKKVTKTKKG